MKLLMFGVYDAVGQTWREPRFVRNQGLALREWAMLANDPSTFVGQYPADYFIYEIGEFDPETGEITTCEPIKLGSGADYVQHESILQAVGE